MRFHLLLQKKKLTEMAQQRNTPRRGCLHSRTLRYAFLLLAALLLGGILYNLVVDKPRNEETTTHTEEDIPQEKKSIYDTLDVLRDYLWHDVMKSAKADSAARAEREKAEREKREAEERGKQEASPATDEDMASPEESGTYPPQTVPTPVTPPQPATAAPSIDKVAAPKVESIDNN